MIKVDRHPGAAGRWPASAVDDQGIAVDLESDAAGTQAVRDGLQAVAFLDPQFGEPVEPGRSLGAGHRHGQDRVFVDHRRRPFGRNVGAAQRPRLDGDIADRLAGGLAFVFDGDRGSHFRQRCQQAGAQRVEADTADGDRRTGHQEGGDDDEGGRRDVAGNLDGAGGQFRLAED